MPPIVVMDITPGTARRAVAGLLTYRLPDDRVSFWTGKYPRPLWCRRTCEPGAVALYGDMPDPEPGEVPDDGGQ